MVAKTSPMTNKGESIQHISLHNLQMYVVIWEMLHLTFKIVRQNKIISANAIFQGFPH